MKAKKYSLATPAMPKGPIPKKLRYLILIIQPNCGFIGVTGFLGFGNKKTQIIAQYFTGKEKGRKGIVQLPELFTKKEATIALKAYKKYNKAFQQKYVYQLVPIDIEQ